MFRCYLNCQGYEAFIVAGIVILGLFSLPQTIRFLRSERRSEGWRFYHSEGPASSIIQIARYESQTSDGGIKVKPPQIYTIAFPGIRENVDRPYGLSGPGSDAEKSFTKEPTVRVVAQPMLRQTQSAVGAVMDWVSAKMTKFIGGPVSMQLGPWVSDFLVG
jgi:hypothetical protein